VFKLRVNQADGTQVLTITDSATSAGPSSQADELTDGDFFSVRWEELVTPGNALATHLAWQFSEDDPNVPPVLFVDVNDAVTVTEAFSKEVQGQRSAFDSITVTEAVELDFSIEADLELFPEVILVTEMVRLVFSIEKLVAESITVTESVTVLLLIPLPAQVSDSITVTEDLKVVFSPMVIRVHDTISVSESAGTDPAGMQLVERIWVTEFVALGVDHLVISVHEDVSVTEGDLNHQGTGATTGIGPDPGPTTPTPSPPGNTGLVDYWTVGI
jgi:hypothetical protein